MSTLSARKFQDPILKSQGNPNGQIEITQTGSSGIPGCRISLEFGAWNLGLFFGVWTLKFGVSQK
jgi:hypothetical protein